MANDTDTILNPGIGGDKMDESLVTRPDTSQAKRPRVVIGGDSYSSGLVEPLASDPVGSETALPVRQVGSISAEFASGTSVVADQGDPAADLNSWPVHQVGSPPLAAGAATSALQTTGNTTLSAINTKIPASPSQEHVTAGSPHAARLTDGTSFYKATTPSDTQPVSAASLPLPTGAATAANQVAGNASLVSIDADIDVPLSSRAAEHITAGSPHAARLTDGTAFYKATTPADTQPISAVALPLPAGAATEATLSTANGHLAAIDADIDVALSSRAAEHVTAVSPHAARLSDGAVFYKATTPADTQPISAVSLPLPTGAATEATQLAVAASLASIDSDVDVLLSSRASAVIQTDGTQKSIARGGSKGVTTPADITSSAEGADHQALDVQLYGAGFPAEVTAANALKVDGSAVTQPVSAVALPLPAGAATAANQTTLGAQTTKINDGTNTVSVTASGALKVDGSAVTQPVSQATSPWVENLAQVGGSAVATIAAGEQRVGVEGVGAAGAALSGNPVQIGASDGANLQVPRVFDVDSGAGSEYVAGVSLRKSASGGSVEAGTATDPLRTDPTGITPQPVTDAGGSLTVDTPQLPAALVGGRLDSNVGAWFGSTAPTVGQKTSANSVPVVVASDQSNLPENLMEIAGFPVATQASGELLVATEGRAASGFPLTGNPVLSAGSDGINARSLLTDASGRQQMVGAAADGAAAAGNPVLVGGQDGANAQSLLTDTSGRPNIVGAAASGAVAAGNPVLAGGTDGANARSLLTDTSGRQVMVGAAADGAAAAGNPVLMAGQDGTNAQSILTDASGRQQMVGAAADGAAADGNPVLVAGQDGVNAQSLFTDTSGRPRVVGAAASGTAVTGDPVLSGGSDGANARSLLTDTAGRQQVVGASADGAAVAGNPVLIGGQDGTNAQSLLTDTSGRPRMVGAAAQGAAVVGDPVLVAAEDGSANVARLVAKTTGIASSDVGLVTRPIPRLVGTHGNAWNSAAVGAGGTSTAIDCQLTPYVSIFGNSNGATNMTVQLSQDNTNWYSTDSNIITGAGDFFFHITTGARYVRLMSSQARTITATIAAKGG